MSAKAIRDLMQSATRFHQAGQLDRAERLYQQILSIRPGHADAVHLLGVIACQRGQFDRGLELISRAIVASPRQSAYHNSLGIALRGGGWGLNRLPEAIAAHRRAVELDPDNLEALNNLAIALDRVDQHAESLAHFDRLIGARGNVAQMHANRGNAQLNANQLESAIASYRRAIELQSDFPVARAKLSVALLSAGQFAEGWAESEWRFHTGTVPDPTIGDPAPRWDGQPLAGRTLLVRCEQGFGDSIQFVRYIRLIDRGGGKTVGHAVGQAGGPTVSPGAGRVVLECQPPLATLFTESNVADEVVAAGQPLPARDVQIPVMSLPHVMRLDEIPPPHPPMDPGDSVRAAWAERVGARAGKFRIGLAWAGNPNHGNDYRRSCPAEVLNALAALGSDVEFYRLQMPAHLPAPSQLQLKDFTSGLTDFTQTAGLISQLDLVISVDTVIAHLAGAMGTAVWILLPFAAEWRWMTQREDSPWYPSARLFRQHRPGDWAQLMQRIVDAARAG
jgi:Tfp pilus assembly protein PilF